MSGFKEKYAPTLAYVKKKLYLCSPNKCARKYVRLMECVYGE